MSKKLIVAITGASGAIYARELLRGIEKHKASEDRISVIFSKNATGVWEHELNSDDHHSFPFEYLDDGNFYAAPASGSAGYDSMIICPASMGTLGRIAHGISDNLISRAADVMLKERKQLIVVPRESPYNSIHLQNMEHLSRAGAIIMPASPSFYSLPNSIEELVNTIITRLLLMVGYHPHGFEWGAS